MASGDTKTEAMLNVLGNGGSGDEFRGCCNTKTQGYILDAIDRVNNVEEEVEELKNNPDVVDIVDTYADLQAYDTQHLTDNDIIRVLQDETHSGNSTYYRFTKNPDTWTFIGEISGGGGGDTVYSDKTTSSSDTGGAVYIGNLNASQVEQEDPTTTDNNRRYFWALPSSNSAIPGDSSVNILGRTFSNRSLLVTIGKDSRCESNSVAIGANALSGGSSVSIGYNVNISEGDSFNNYNNYVAIGAQAKARTYGVAVGNSANAYATNSVAIGNGAQVWQDNSVALGKGAYPTRQGEVYVGCDNSTAFNNTNYRVIGGVHDPVDAHDAATKGYVDAHAGGPVQTISSADLNWNSNVQSATAPYDSVALWLLPTGVYVVDNPNGDFQVFSNSDGRADYCDPSSDSTIISLINPQTPGETATITIYAPGNPSSAAEEIYVVNDTGAPANGGYLESTFHTPRYGMDVPFALVNKASGTPANNGAVGFVGDLFVDTDTFSLYVCTSRDDTDPDNPVCTWSLLASV